MSTRINISLLLNYLIITLAFVIPLSYHLRDIILGLIIIFWIIEGNFKKKFKKFKTIDIGLILYISVFILLLISNIWSYSLIGGSFKLKQYYNSIDFWVRFYLFYLSIIPIIITSFNKKYTIFVIKAFIFAMLISEITSYGIIFGLWQTKYGSVLNPTPFLRYHSIYSLFLVIAIFWLFKIFVEEKKKFKKFLIGVFIFTATTNLFFNSGRTGQVLFIFLLFFTIVYYYKFSIKNLIIFFIVLFFTFGLYYNLSKNFHSRMNQGYNDIKNILLLNKFNSSWGGRVYCWILAKKIWIEHPILGIGMGSTKQTMLTITKKDYQNMYKYTLKNLPHLHNQYLQILVEIGIIGEIVFILALIRFYFIKYNKEIEYFIYILLIAYTIANFTEVFFMKPPTFLFYNLFLSLFIINTKDKI